jgi:hypothetical protein
VTSPAGARLGSRRLTATYLFISAAEPVLAAIAVSAAPAPPDLCVTSPSSRARATAAFACVGHLVRTMDEPLLAKRDDSETCAAVADRFAAALRRLSEFDSRSVLVVVDEIGLHGSHGFELDGASLLCHADRIERARSVDVDTLHASPTHEPGRSLRPPPGSLATGRRALRSL